MLPRSHTHDTRHGDSGERESASAVRVRGASVRRGVVSRAVVCARLCVVRCACERNCEQMFNPGRIQPHYKRHMYMYIKNYVQSKNATATAEAINMFTHAHCTDTVVPVPVQHDGATNLRSREKNYTSILFKYRQARRGSKSNSQPGRDAGVYEEGRGFHVNW